MPGRRLHLAHAHFRAKLMRQTIGEVDDDGVQHAKLVLATHENTDAALSRTVDRLGDLDVVRAVASVIRAEGQ